MRNVKKRIGVLITNPNHHWQMVRPVIRELKARGHSPVLISFCGLRRLDDLTIEYTNEGVEYRLSPRLQTLGFRTGSGRESLGSGASIRRRALQAIFWSSFLRFKLVPLFNDINKLLILNDSSFPANWLVPRLIRNGVSVSMLQEGIRFSNPGESGGFGYGNSGLANLFCWGDSSKAFFDERLKASESRVVVVGNPRYDELLLRDWTAEAQGIRDQYSLRERCIGFASNPIDDLGFCTPAEKFELTTRFFKEALPILEKHNCDMLTKLHPREDEGLANDAIRAAGGCDSIKVLTDSSIFPFLQLVERVVIMASTVGLEALAMKRPLAVLELPSQGFVHDFVSKDAAVGIEQRRMSYHFDRFIGLEFSAEQEHYINSHLKMNGSSSQLIAEKLIRGAT